MGSILALLLVIAVFIVYFAFLFKYPDWLEKEKGCSPMAGGRIAVALAALLFAVLSSSNDGPVMWLYMTASITLFIVVFLLNLKASGNVMQAFLMTLWQATVVVTIVIAIFKTMDMFNKRRGK